MAIDTTITNKKLGFLLKQVEAAKYILAITPPKNGRTILARNEIKEPATVQKTSSFVLFSISTDSL